MTNLDYYDILFDRFKKYIEDNNSFNTTVVKTYNNSSSKFPLISYSLNNNIDTNNCTLDYIEKYEAFYFTIDIYTKDKTITIKENIEDKVIEKNVTYASQYINDELRKLVINFFGNSLRMKKTLDKATPNLDTSIYRKTIQYQCLIGSAKGNVIGR